MRSYTENNSGDYKTSNHSSSLATVPKGGIVFVGCSQASNLRAGKRRVASPTYSAEAKPRFFVAD